MQMEKSKLQSDLRNNKTKYKGNGEHCKYYTWTRPSQKNVFHSLIYEHCECLKKCQKKWFRKRSKSPCSFDEIWSSSFTYKNAAYFSRVQLQDT